MKSHFIGTYEDLVCLRRGFVDEGGKGFLKIQFLSHRNNKDIVSSALSLSYQSLKYPDLAAKPTRGVLYHTHLGKYILGEREKII